MNKLLAKAALAAAALLALGAQGCAPSFDHLVFDQRTSPPLSVTLTQEQIAIPAGIAVDFIPVPMDGTKKLDKPVSLTSSNPSVLGVAPDADGTGFVIFGVAQGTATLDVVYDGNEEPGIPATVSSQSQPQ